MGIDDMGPSLLLKKIDKEVIMKDIKFRGAISDFKAVGRCKLNYV